ncbi:VanZ family protein [Bradyrhizobium sp. SYSU BS000235]|uniref:VanZ family protein n=1 Tax=Bradyrhizobium sp. SYSU BS000235 TaxID=3411332 RepID=UPI003C788AB1
MTIYRRLAATAAWLSLGFIAFATLSPLGVRPHVAGVGFEHVAAFAVTGVLFALAYPRHSLIVAILVLGSATILELSQLLTPDRHARFSDLLVKLAGGSIGIAVARFWDRP